MNFYSLSDTSFDGLNRNSTDDEIISAILDRLIKSRKGEYFSDWNLRFLDTERTDRIVDNMIKAKIVEIAGTVYGTSNYPLKIAYKGVRIIEEHGSWLKYATLEKNKNKIKLIIQICDSILMEIYLNGYFSLSKDDDEERFMAKNRLETGGLIFASKKNNYKLTNDGLTAVEIGGYENWLNIGKKQENFATPKIDNNHMNQVQRLELIKKIADKLAANNVKQINTILKGYSFTNGLQESVYSKKNYVIEILSNSNENVLLLLMAKDLGIDESKTDDSIKRESEQVPKKQTSMKMNKIFLSHASNDMEIVDVFLEFLETIGVSDERIFYSSKSWTGVGIGEDFLDRIKSEINEDTIVITFLSENFYKSIVSICEMGAAWVKTEKTQAILIPPFDYSKMEGAIKKTKIVLKMDRTFRITELKEYIEKEMGLSPMSNTKWEHKRTKLLNEIARVLKLE